MTVQKWGYVHINLRFTNDGSEARMIFLNIDGKKTQTAEKKGSEQCDIWIAKLGYEGYEMIEATSHGGYGIVVYDYWFKRPI